LLLEKTYRLYTDYEKQLLNKQLEQNQQQLEQNQQELQQKTLELEEERQYRLGLQESLLANTTPIEPTQVFYHQTRSV
jgi:hypothetical protein